MDAFSQVTGFEWDDWNITKNFQKHHVGPFECEEVFFNEPLLISKDKEHSRPEARCFAMGRTNSERFLSIAFTMRGDKIRVIMARDMTRKERIRYEQAQKRYK